MNHEMRFALLESVMGAFPPSKGTHEHANMWSAILPRCSRQKTMGEKLTSGHCQ
jgi:hypothetical protein